MEGHLNQTGIEQIFNNTTPIERQYDGDFMMRSIVLSLLVFTIFISLVCCHRERISKCFEHYLTTNGPSSDTEYANRVWRQHMENEAKKMETPEKRRARLWENIEKNAVFMVIEQSCFFLRDQVSNETEMQGDIDVDEPDTPPSSYQDEDLEIQLSHGSENGSRRVPNCCAVCLSGYNEGDTIVWSNNEECKHAFHDECILIWLVKNQNGTPCPCCRCEFTDLDLSRIDERGDAENQINLFPLVSTLRVRYSSRRERQS